MVVLNTTHKALLRSLDLTSNEIEVYIGFLSSSDVTAAEIARNIKMDKSSAYRAVENLESLGLIVSSPKKSGTTYKTASSDAVKKIYNQKVRKLESQKSEINNLVEEIRKHSSSRSTNIRVEYGYDAHINSMEQSLLDNPGKLILEKWDMQNPIFNDPKYGEYVHQFAKRRIKLGIKDKYLVNSDFNNEFSALMHTSKKLLKEVRIVPEDANDTNSIRIYNDNTELISFDDNSEYIIITISDKFVTEMIRKMFYFIWNRSEIIKK